MNRKISAVVLAAGKSKRTKSSLPKVLLDLGGRPFIFHILKTLESIKVIDKVIVVLGHKKDLIREAIEKDFRKVCFVYQKKLNGTAKALETVNNALRNKDNVLVICADTPLAQASTLKEFINFFFKKNLDCAIITARFDKKTDYGRILRDERGNVKNIIEKTDDVNNYLSEEINSGIYCFRKGALFKNLKKIKINKKKKEYFLTDIIDIFYNKNLSIGGFFLKDNTEIIGVNTQGGLALVRKILNRRLLDGLMNKGVMIIDPDTTFVSFDTKIGKDSIVYPFTFIEKNVIIGNNCTIGPFVRLRTGSVIKDDTKIGNFIEVNRSKVGKNVRMKHFGYLGDTTVGEGTNIGAGVVVANYDGKRKHRTFIKKKAFIGSDTIIVAPVKIGEGALTGAGSVVTRNVRNNTLVMGVPARVFRKKDKRKQIIDKRKKNRKKTKI